MGNLVNYVNNKHVEIFGVILNHINVIVSNNLVDARCNLDPMAFHEFQ